MVSTEKDLSIYIYLDNDLVINLRATEVHVQGEVRFHGLDLAVGRHGMLRQPVECNMWWLGNLGGVVYCDEKGHSRYKTIFLRC